MVTIHQRHRQTDGQMACNSNTTLCTVVHCTVKIVFYLTVQHCRYLELRFWAEVRQLSLLSRLCYLHSTEECRELNIYYHTDTRAAA